MSALIEPNHEQTRPSSQAKLVTNEPTTQEIKGWNVAKLLEWIKQKKPHLLRDEDIEKFKTARISGRTFLKYAGNTDFFRNDCHLPPRTSSDLTDLAKDLADPATETNDRKSEAQKFTLNEALFKEGLTEKAQCGLSALTGEERIRILRHIGTKPLPDDQYGRLPSVIEHLSPDWNHKESILDYPNKTFVFPVINQQALFVRQCYHELYEIVAKLPTVVQWVRILLTGTPGIGKSAFLIYFIIRYLYESTITPDSRKNPAASFQNDKRSAISSGQTRDILIFQPAGTGNEFYAFAGPNIVRVGTCSDFEAFFLSTTWYLVDWRPIAKPITTPATTLFALSPNSIRDEDFKNFGKVLAMRLCMPVWTYDELEKCRYHVFPELSNRSLNYIYDRIGGIPRSCLEAPTIALRLGLGEEQAHERDLRRLQDAFYEIKDPLKVLRAQEESLGSGGRLLYKAPDSETLSWDGRHHVWASAYVIDRFVNMMDTDSASNMNREVIEGLARNERDGTLGKIFECYVRYLFFKGGGAKLRKRRLYGALDKRKEPEPRQWFTMPKNLEHKPFSGIIDFAIPKDTGTIWTPGPNFPGIDMILTLNSLFQITISPHHPVKQEPLRKILEKLPAKEKISLYFIVPEEDFETFTFRNEQWVLGVPLGVSSKENAEQSDVQGMKRAANEDDVRQPQTPRKRTKA